MLQDRSQHSQTTGGKSQPACALSHSQTGCLSHSQTSRVDFMTASSAGPTATRPAVRFNRFYGDMGGAGRLVRRDVLL